MNENLGGFKPFYHNDTINDKFELEVSETREQSWNVLSAVLVVLCRRVVVRLASFVLCFGVCAGVCATKLRWRQTMCGRWLCILLIIYFVVFCVWCVLRCVVCMWCVVCVSDVWVREGCCVCVCLWCSAVHWRCRRMVGVDLWCLWCECVMWVFCCVCVCVCVCGVVQCVGSFGVC